MSGWLTIGFSQLSKFLGTEQMPLDTGLTAGSNPESAMTTTQQLSPWLKYFAKEASKTMVSGSRYYSSFVLGNAQTLTGIIALVGGTGGTDSWIFELHDSTGALVATTATAGTTAGTANTFQQIAFTAVYQAAPGTYYIAVQGNGTTATLGVYSSPGLTGLVTGSATGSFGTGASITPPTTYTANLGPIAVVY